MQPPSLSGTFDKYSKRTRKEIFLTKMDGLIPWQALCAVIESHYPKAGNGRPPRGLAKNASRAFVLLALFNIVQWNRQLTP